MLLLAALAGGAPAGALAQEAAPAGAAAGLSAPAGAPVASPAAQVAAKLRSGDKAGALRVAEEYLATHPRDAQMRFLRAVVLTDLNRTAEAVPVLEALIEDFPELPESYNNLAVIRAGQGQLPAAEHLLQLAIAAQPSYVTARENLGDLYVSMAAAQYEQAARLGANNSADNAAIVRKLTLVRELGGRLRGAP